MNLRPWQISAIKEFFKAKNSYAAAKLEVNNLLQSNESATLFDGLERLRQGGNFEQVF